MITENIIDYQGNGYAGLSMSNNAIEAYSKGKMPKSKWTKKIIVDRIREYSVNNHVIFDMKKFNKISKDILQKKFLITREWHHVSAYYTPVDFYELNQKCLEKLNDVFLDELILETKKESDIRKEKKQQEKAMPKQQDTNLDGRWKCEYDVFLGLRGKYKKTYTVEGYIEGKYFISDDGVRKLITGKHFRLLEKLDK